MEHRIVDTEGRTHSEYKEWATADWMWRNLEDFYPGVYRIQSV